MKSIDKEKVGDEMLAEYMQWKDSEASAKSTWFRGQKRWEGAEWSGWNAGWQAEGKYYWKGDGKGKGSDSTNWHRQTDAGPGFGQVEEMDAATLLEEVQKRQQVIDSGTDSDALMKALGETVKLQQQLFHLLSEGGAKTAEAKASAESAAPQEPAAGEAVNIEVEVPMNADGECEAVSRLGQRDLAGCLTCIRASGHQVVIGGGA